MRVEIDKKAQKDYLSLPKEMKKRVVKYRILFDVIDVLLTIYEIRHRKEAYKK
ncbi:MAG: type II toxin-antitoxin system RelE family toxin [Campylobacterales bacterium]